MALGNKGVFREMAEHQQYLYIVVVKKHLHLELHMNYVNWIVNCVLS